MVGKRGRSRDYFLSTTPKNRPGPPGGKRALNRRHRVESLLSSACRLFLGQGVEATTIAQITAEAGTAKGSFYHYFRDKEELVATLFRSLSERVEEALDEALESLAAAETEDALSRAYRTLGLRMLPALLGEKDLVQLYLQESRGFPSPCRRPITALRERIDASALELTQAAHSRGIWRPFPPQVSAFAVVGAVEKGLHHVLTSEPEADASEWVPSLVSLVIDGLASRK